MTEATAQTKTSSHDEISDFVASYVDAASAVLGLNLSPEHRPGVITNLQFMFDESAALMALDLDWEEEAVMVFEP